MSTEHARQHGSAYYTYNLPYEFPEADSLCVHVRLKDDRQVEPFRAMMTEKYPILRCLRFEISISGACVWWLIYNSHREVELYESWRHCAWSIWEETETTAEQNNFMIQDISVVPLPGPWLYKFL